MSKGFISIERDLWEHPLFMPSEMTEREAWIWMIAQAAWSETRHRVGRELVTVERGSFMATLREMQSAFMWKSDKRVRTFLKTLEKEGMIGRRTRGAKNAPKTHITICNYEEYQSRGRTKDAPKTQERTHHGRTTDAVKKQNNKITNTSSNEEDGQAVDGEVVDFAKELFDRAVTYLGRHGVAEGKARGIVGRWRKGSEDAEIFAALKSASKSGVIDPVSYVTASLKPKAMNPTLDELFQGTNG